jgi:hypothetical protein
VFPSVASIKKKCDTGYMVTNKVKFVGLAKLSGFRVTTENPSVTQEVHDSLRLAFVVWDEPKLCRRFPHDATTCRLLLDVITYSGYVACFNHFEMQKRPRNLIVRVSVSHAGTLTLEILFDLVCDVVEVFAFVI